jgi:hypothetical protein
VRIESMTRRRISQLRPDIPAGATPSADVHEARIFRAHIQTCMPPIEFPSCDAQVPVTSRYRAVTMSS